MGYVLFISFFILFWIQFLFVSCNNYSKKEKLITYIGITENLYGLENAVIHTIDDYSNDLILFLDFLDHFKIKSTIFIDRTHLIPDSAWTRLNKSYLSGNELGSHTRHHTFIYSPINEKTASILLNDSELKESFQDIMSHTSQPWVWSFAYPGGEGYQFVSVQKRLQEAGYIVARRFTGFLDMDEGWKTYPRDSFNDKTIPDSRFAILPDKMYLGDYNTEIAEFLRIIKKQHRYIFVTHPKGLDYSEKSNLHNFFKYLNSFPDTWFVPLGYYAQYRTLSESVKLEVRENNDSTISLLINNPLPDSVYNVPLTFSFKIKYGPKTISHDGNYVSPETPIPYRIMENEFYFLRQDTLFVQIKPRGKIDIVLDKEDSIKNIVQKSKSTSIIKTKSDPIFNTKVSLNSDIVQPYIDFRNSLLNEINSLKTKVPLTEDKARKITFLYYRIGELDSAFTYLEQSGVYDEAFVHCAKVSVNISRILLWQQNISVSDSVLATPLKFKSKIGNEKLIVHFARLLYTDGYDKRELRFISEYDMNSALNLLRSSQEPFLDNLLLQAKCLEFLIESDSIRTDKSRLSKEVFGCYCMLGQQYSQQGMLYDAIPFFKKAIRIDPFNSEVYNDMGVAYNIKGLSEDAIDSFKKSIQLNPEFALAHYNLAMVYFKIGRNKESLESLKQCLRLGYNEIDPTLLQLLEENKSIAR